MNEKARGGIKLEAKLLVLVGTLVASVLNALYASFVEQVTVVYTHFFYIPILLAGMWYKRKEAVAVALFLGIVHILITYLSPLPLTVNEFARAAIFVLVAYVIGYVSEQRAQREDALRGSEGKYRAFFNTSRDPVFITSTDGRWLDFNEPLVELLGYESRDEVFKVRIPDLYETPEDRRRHIELINQEGFTNEFPVNLRRKDGSIINVLATSIAKKDENGTIIGYQGTIRDITERKKAEEALRESEEKYRLVVEHATEAIVVAQDNRLKLVNPKAVELTGYSGADLTSLPFVEFIHPEDRELVLERHRKRLRGEELPSVYPFRILRKDGTIRWVEINAVVIIWEGRLATLNFLTDITEWRKADEELEKRRQELSERVKELNCLYGLSKLVEQRDLSLEAILQGCVELFPPAYLYPEITCARIVVEGKEFRSKNFKATPWKLSSTLRLRNEPIGAVEVYYLKEQPELDVGPFLQEEQKLLEAVAERLGKIIERKRVEDALRKSETKYKTLAENIPQKIFIKDINSVYVSCNENYARDLKIKSNEIVGKTDYDFHPKELADKYRADDKRVIESGKEEELEEKYITDGREVWVNTIKTPVKDENENVIGVLGIFGDITDRKQAEEDRVRLVKELEAKNRELERFTYTVSHDLRSPLVTIQGFAEMLSRDLQAKKVDKATSDLQYITNATVKMDTLLSDTLHLSRIGRITNPPEAVPFGAIVQDALEQLAGELQSSGVEVSVAEEFPTVHVDRMRLVQVLVNLIGNSIKYRGEHPHPKVEIGYRRVGKETTFFVKDNGIGLDTSEHEKVFELFYKVDKSSEGTGAGLAIVKRIIEVHNGRIWLESEKGKGCTVWFTLPIT
jgi:PAS domain S-box-containing protein